jgi:hypothetical protein
MDPNKPGDAPHFIFSAVLRNTKMPPNFAPFDIVHETSRPNPFLYDNSNKEEDENEAPELTTIVHTMDKVVASNDNVVGIAWHFPAYLGAILQNGQYQRVTTLE